MENGINTDEATLDKHEMEFYFKGMILLYSIYLFLGREYYIQ